ncbi:hypothetical protein ACROYT_G000639 [Oculina patagonica]
MADEAKFQLLESKIAVARRELNKLRSDMHSMKKMFVQKLKEIKEMAEKGNQKSIPQDSHKGLASDHNPQRQDTPIAFHSEMEPIGFVESCFKEKNGIPRQPSVCPAAKAKLCVSVKGFTNPEHSLDGLENFSHVWIIFLFHKNTNKAVKAKVKPPRLDGAKVGVFASRSPHRPNPIGLTLAKLDAIVGNTLFLSAIDLLDGTPVLDIKPYVPDYDKPLSLHEVKDKLELENSECQNEDILGCKELVSQPVPVSSGSQLIEQSSLFSMKENMDLKSELTSPSIAEWIRKPPITELEVKFSDEAVDQISCFHGKKQSLSNTLDGKFDDLSVYKCTCFKNFEEVSECLAAKTTGEEPQCFNQDNSQSEICPWKLPGGSSAKTDDHGNFSKEFKLSSTLKTSLNEKSNEALKYPKGGGFQEELLLRKKVLLCAEMFVVILEAFPSL